MANQAIALQARAPQNDFMGRAIQQNAQFINMMSQQRAAERQAAVAQQEMEIARAAEARAAAKEGRDIERFAVDQDALLYAKYRNMAPSVIESNDPEVYAQWLGMLNKEIPQKAQIIARAMPPERFDKETFRRMMATMDQSFEARYGKAITKELIVPGPTPDSPATVLGANISGLPGATYAAPIPDISRPRAGAPAQTPGAGVDATATRGTATGPADLRAQGVDPRSIPSGNPLQPISMTTGAQMGGQPDMTAVVQDMMSSGQISQSNLQLMREMAGPDKDAQLAQILKANNIQIVPDEQPGMRSAVFRPGQDVAPQMQQVQFNPNDYEPVRVKSPMQSPLPGSAQVPLPRVRAEAEAGREPIPEAGARAAAQRPSASEVTATERARAQADADVKFMERFPSDRDSTRQMIALINNMIGDTYVENGRLMVKKGGRQPAPGFEDVIGATWRPGFRFVPGTAAADFDAKQKQIEGGTFLEAFERLKGGGQITQIEGEKATRAISRMERSVSEIAYVEAARELEGIIRTALKRAEDRYARLQGQKPAAQTGAPKRLRFNPATGGFE